MSEMPEEWVEAAALVLIKQYGFRTSVTPDMLFWNGMARAALAVIVPMVEAAERERCAKIATDFRVSDSRAPHKNIRDGIAAAIRRDAVLK